MHYAGIISLYEFRLLPFLIANVGHSEAVLSRNGKPLCLTNVHVLGRSSQSEYKRVRKEGAVVTETNEVDGIASCTRLLGCSFLYPALIPNPHTLSLLLCKEDEFVILASRGVWDRISPVEAVRRIRPITNPQLAAKHIQDMAQAYDASGNLSVLIVRFLFRSKSSNRTIQLPTNGQKPTIRSDMHLDDLDDNLTDSDVQSEPNGNTIMEKPNYYFDYKKRLKELKNVESDECIKCEEYPTLKDISFEPRVSISRQRFEAARTSVIGKLKLMIPENMHNRR